MMFKIEETEAGFGIQEFPGETGSHNKVRET